MSSTKLTLVILGLLLGSTILTAFFFRMEGFQIVHRKTPTQASEVKHLLSLGKDELIRLAEQKIKVRYPYFTPSLFDVITINNTEDQVWLNFDHTYRYVPLNSSAYYGVSVGLVSSAHINGVFPLNLKNPRDYPVDPSRFFQPTEESRQAIQFVLDANKKRTDGDIDLQGMVIYEEATHYRVELIGKADGVLFNVEKATGVISDEIHEIYAPNPFPPPKE